MITDEDTTKIVSRIIQANHELFYTKPEMDSKFEGLRKDFSKLQSSVDAFVKITKNNEDQTVVINQRLVDHSDWIQKAAPKIGVEFKP